MGIKFIIFFIIGTIAYGTNMLLKFILRKNDIQISYVNTFIIEYIKFFRLIRNSKKPEKYYYILLMCASIVAYGSLFYYLYYIITSQLN